MTESATASSSAMARQVPVVLRTSEVTLSIPEVPYLIPTSWRRAQLSTLVNRLLQQDQAVEDEVSDAAKPSVPFDFIVDGELLRTSLDRYLESKGLTEESTLEIEYVRSTLPPKYTAAFPHDDWISSVDASCNGLFLTSSYDGSLRVFGTSTMDKPLNIFRPPNQAASLTDACWIQSSASSSRVATVGMDGMLRICNIPDKAELESSSKEGSGALESASLVKAFETPSPLTSVRAHANNGDERLITAGWDGCVAVWQTGVAEAGMDDDRAVKRRRKGVKGEASASNQDAPSMTPLSILWHTSPAAMGLDRMPGQNARVSTAVWMGSKGHATEAASAGWDGSVRLWDVQGGRATTTKTSDKVILCLDAMQAQRDQQLVVTGHMDRSAALWDLRTNTASNIAVAFVNAHASPVGAVRSHPHAANLFATGSHDGVVKMWDVRSPRAALFALSRPSNGGNPGKANGSAPSSGAQKILGLDWDPTGQTIVSGGEDCQLSVFRGEGIGREGETGKLTA